MKTNAIINPKPIPKMKSTNFGMKDLALPTLPTEAEIGHWS
jgi:hypothetical protein